MTRCELFVCFRKAHRGRRTPCGTSTKVQHRGANKEPQPEGDTADFPAAFVAFVSADRYGYAIGSASRHSVKSASIAARGIFEVGSYEGILRTHRCDL